MEDLPAYNDMDKLLTIIFFVFYDNRYLELYIDFYILFIGYFYANNYNVNNIRVILDKINANFDHYYDLVNMNINKNLNIDVYYFIENLLKEKDNNKKLIK